jgi:hypothetical protein
VSLLAIGALGILTAWASEERPIVEVAVIVIERYIVIVVGKIRRKSRVRMRKRKRGC